MEPFLTHVELWTLGVTNSVELHLSPGGQGWQMSALGRRMYSAGRQGLHCWASCEYLP